MVVESLVAFEAQRRATLLTLALQAYRLEHGQLPESIEAIEGEFFDELPRDPYSGRDFVYFPDGPPEPRGPDEELLWENIVQHHKMPGREPCLWSPGVRLEARVWDRDPAIPGQNATYHPADPETKDVYYLDRASGAWRPEPLFGFGAWHLGVWYPIPPAGS